MSATISIPIELANKIVERAAARGLGLEEYACEVLGHDASSEAFVATAEKARITNGEIQSGIDAENSVEQPGKTNEAGDKKKPRRVPMIEATKELQWLSEHRHEYLGQWVALDGDRLLAHGTNAREVFAVARQSTEKVPLVEYISPLDDLPFGGW